MPAKPGRIKCCHADVLAKLRPPVPQGPRIGGAAGDAAVVLAVDLGRTRSTAKQQAGEERAAGTMLKGEGHRHGEDGDTGDRRPYHAASICDAPPEVRPRRPPVLMVPCLQPLVVLLLRGASAVRESEGALHVEGRRRLDRVGPLGLPAGGRQARQGRCHSHADGCTVGRKRVNSCRRVCARRAICGAALWNAASRAQAVGGLMPSVAEGVLIVKPHQICASTADCDLRMEDASRATQSRRPKRKQRRRP
eukprot:scaffold434_cov186-Pinguiococcus_pyrenoidosus.AAC.152